MEKETRYKEYTKFISEKYDLKLTEEEIDSLMFSFGLVYEEE